MVGVVVAADVEHQRAAAQVGRLQPRRQQRLRGGAVAGDDQRRQVTQMAVAPRQAMAPGLLRVEMATRRAGGDRTAVREQTVRIALRRLIERAGRD